MSLTHMLSSHTCSRYNLIYHSPPSSLVMCVSLNVLEIHLSCPLMLSLHIPCSLFWYLLFLNNTVPTCLAYFFSQYIRACSYLVIFHTLISSYNFLFPLFVYFKFYSQDHSFLACVLSLSVFSFFMHRAFMLHTRTTMTCVGLSWNVP